MVFFALFSLLFSLANMCMHVGVGGGDRAQHVLSQGEGNFFEKIPKILQNQLDQKIKEKTRIKKLRKLTKKGGLNTNLLTPLGNDIDIVGHQIVKNTMTNICDVDEVAKVNFSL